MERLKNKACRRYLRQVRRLLPCARDTRNRITAELRASLAAFSEENPAVTAEELQARFGMPETVAASCLEATETAVVLRKLQTKRRIVKAVAATLLLMLLFWVGLQVIVYQNVKSALNGYSVISEIEIDSIAP